MWHLQIHSMWHWNTCSGKGKYYQIPKVFVFSIYHIMSSTIWCKLNSNEMVWTLIRILTSVNWGQKLWPCGQIYIPDTETVCVLLVRLLFKFIYLVVRCLPHGHTIMTVGFNNFAFNTLVWLQLVSNMHLWLYSMSNRCLTNTSMFKSLWLLWQNQLYNAVHGSIISCKFLQVYILLVLG